METVELLRTRLINQQLLAQKFKKPAEIIHWLGAVQAQEYAMAKWAVGLRLPTSTEASIEKAFNEGKILRTHLLRPTWHFVSPQDIRWLLELTAPHVHRLNSYYYKQQGLNEKSLERSANIICKALEGGHYLTRTELKEALAPKIKAESVRLACIIMYTELEGLICSGPRKGKQFTYALMDERVKTTKKLTREEGLEALMLRYFTSRGPASLKDFCYWSGLNLTEVKPASALLKKKFETVRIGTQECFFKPAEEKNSDLPLRTFLMPDYDEYGMSYKERGVLAHPKLKKPMAFNRMVIVDGVICGSWQRTFEKNQVSVEVVLNTDLTRNKQKELDKAINDLKKFTGTSNDDDKIE